MKTLPKTFLQIVDETIKEHLDKKDLLRILEKRLQLSSSQVYRKIKQQTEHSPSIYIRHKRLEQAHLWIVQSDLSITRIAGLVGFRQLTYFSRCFVKFYGYAPSFLRWKGGNA